MADCGNGGGDGRSQMVPVRPRSSPSRAKVRRTIATVLLPWLTAKFLFKPRIGPLRKDRMLDRLGFWRSVAGVAVIAAVTYRYRDVSSDLIPKAMETGRLAVLVLPLPFLVMLIVTRSGHRTRLLLSVLRLLGRAALALTAFYLPFVLIFAAVDKLSLSSFANSDVHFQFPGDVSGPEALLLLPIILNPWFWTFWYCTIYWAARTGFWVNEIHPLLAPLYTTFLVLLINGQEVIGGNVTSAPYPLWLTLNLCGTASCLVLSAFEYRHLRSIGYRFRSGPDARGLAKESGEGPQGALDLA